MGDGQAVASNPHVQLAGLVPLSGVGGLEGENVVVAGGVEDLAEPFRDVVRVLDEAPPAAERDLGQGLPAPGVGPGAQRPLGPGGGLETADVHGVDDGVGQGQRVVEASELLLRPRVAEVPLGLHLPVLPVRDRFAGARPVLALLAHQHRLVEPGREEDDVLAALEAVEERRESGEAVEEPLDSVPVLGALRAGEELPLGAEDLGGLGVLPGIDVRGGGTRREVEGEIPRELERVPHALGLDDAEPGNRLLQLGAVAREADEDAGPRLAVRGHRREVPGGELRPHELARRVAGLHDPERGREREVEQQQELPSRRRLEKRARRGTRAAGAGVDLLERDDPRLAALVPDGEVGRGEPGDGVAGLVRDEHRDRDHVDVGAEHGDVRARERLRARDGGRRRGDEHERDEDRAAASSPHTTGRVQIHGGPPLTGSSEYAPDRWDQPARRDPRWLLVD